MSPYTASQARRIACSHLPHAVQQHIITLSCNGICISLHSSSHTSTKTSSTPQCVGSQTLTSHHSVKEPKCNLADLQGACCLTELAGQTFTDATQLATALTKKIHPSSDPQLYAFDHIYSSDPETSLGIWQADNASAAVLYGAPGTACFQEMHQMLKETVTKQYTEGGLHTDNQPQYHSFCLLSSAWCDEHSVKPGAHA